MRAVRSRGGGLRVVRTEAGCEDAVEYPVRQHPRQAGEQGRVATNGIARARLPGGHGLGGMVSRIVGDLVGAQHARRFAALLLTSAHGITDMEASGRLSPDRWHVTAEELVSTLVSMIGRSA